MQSRNNLTTHGGPRRKPVVAAYWSCGVTICLILTMIAVTGTLFPITAADRVLCDKAVSVATVSVATVATVNKSTDERFGVPKAKVPEGSTASRELRLPPELHSYNIPNLPPHFNNLPEEYRAIADSVIITDAAATLGRVLFYDRSLSRSRTIACASCHIQEFAFSDSRRFSEGHDGRMTARQSMSLINLKYSLTEAFFWDERARGLQQQVLIPIENDVEMGHSLADLVIQLQVDPIYPPLFDDAFGSPQVSKKKIARALSQFVLSIVSYRSEYDSGMAKANSVLDAFPNFTALQNLGKRQFFEAGCASCHLSEGSEASVGKHISADVSAFDFNRPVLQTAIFQIEKSVVNGIDSDDSSNDAGVGSVTGQVADQGAFRSPSLRNVEVTGPYMHDGRFRTLDSVVEHYNWSVQPHPNLDPRLHFAVEGIAIPEFQKVALVAFLKTLTDHKLLKDARFSDPFVRH